jgi:CheY-like chemotaxis protein
LGDTTQLHQVILNLCVNARDAMPEGGTLTLEARQTMVDAVLAGGVPEARPGKYVALRVRDTGTGIPPDVLDRIFDPFFTTKALGKGTGLGLSTVTGIVKGHSGFMKVYSQPGQGSTFTVFLPANDATTDAGAKVDGVVGEAFVGSGETILVVDDEPAIRQIMAAVLQRLNLKVVTAADGRDGLARLAGQRDELRAVITDLHMPNMGGLEFVRQLRRMLPDIPVALTSGRLEKNEEDEFKALNVTVCLNKPFAEGELVVVLQKLLNTAKVRS